MKKVIINENKELIVNNDTSLKQDTKLDLTFTKENNSFVTNTKHFNAKFVSSLENDEILALNRNNHLLKMNYLGKKNKVKVKTNQNKMIYEDIAQGVDLEYQCQDKRIKESLIIKERQEKYDYDFTLNIGDLTTNFNELENTLELCKNGKVIYRILSPYMEDNRKVRSDDCSYVIEEENGILKLTLHCDSGWINSEERLFPVIVDPTIEVVDEEVLRMDQLVNDSMWDEEGDTYLVGKTIAAGGVILRHAILFRINEECIDGKYNKLVLTFKVDHCENISSDGEVYQLINDNNVIREFRYFPNENEVSIDISDVLKSNDDQIILSGPISCKLYIYNLRAEEEKCPKLIMSYNEIKQENVKTYDLYKSGATVVNVEQKNYRHELPITSISENNLNLDLSLIYDSKEKSSNKDYIGKGWRTNFHQYLIKETNYDSNLKSKVMKYIDSKGISHYFYEKWYYLDGNNQKHFLSKDNVYIDDDFKLKTKNGEEIFEVKYEFESNKEDLTLVSAAHFGNYYKKKDVVSKKRYYVEISDGHRIYVTIKDGLVEAPVFTNNNETSIFKYKDIKYNGVYITTNNQVVKYKTKKYKVCLEEDGLFFENVVDNSSLGKEKIEIKEELLYALMNNKKDGDIYLTEELQNINSQIEQLISNINSGIKQLDLNYESLKYYKFCEDEKITYELEELQNELKGIRDDRTKNIKVKDPKDYNDPEVIDKNLQILYNAFSDNLSDAQDLYNKALTDKKKEFDCAAYDNLLLECCDMIDNLKALKAQKSALIESQMKQVNDLILDEEGNVLGFDGFGRLITIQDKWENQIKIEYGYEESEGKLLSVYTETQSIKFSYNSEGLLSSILDSKGKKTSFTHSNKQLVKVTHNDKTKTIFKYDDFGVTSPLLETIKINEYNSELVVTKTCYDGDDIDNEKLLNETAAQKQISKHLYIYNINKTVIKNLINKNDEDIIEDEVTLYYDNNNITKVITSKDITNRYYCNDNLELETSYQKDEESLFDFEIPTGNKVYKIELDDILEKKDADLLGLRIILEDELSSNFLLKVNIWTLSGNNKNLFSYSKSLKYCKLSEYILPISIIDPLTKFIRIGLNPYQSFSSETIKEIELIKLKEGKIYDYDNENRLILELDGDKKITYLDFNEDDFPLTKKEINEYNDEIITNYSYNANNQLTCVEDSKQNIEEYYYDDKGNCIEKRSYNKKDASLMKVEKVTYDEKGRVSSALGDIKTKEGVYPKEEIIYLPGTTVKSKVIGLNGETTNYNYDCNTGDLLSISSSSNGLNNSTSFTYNYGLLTSISHHGMKVNYTYDGKGRKTKISLNGEDVVNNIYEDCYQVTYNDPFNNEQVSFSGLEKTSKSKDGLIVETYIDEDGKCVLTKYDANDTYGATKYVYNNKNKVDKITSKIIYINTNETYLESYHYTYNEFDAIIKKEKRANNKSQVILKDNYDSENRYITSTDVILSETEDRINYLNNYNDEHQIIGVQVRKAFVDDDNHFDQILDTTFNYDVLGRVTHQSTETSKIKMCHEYSYLQQDEKTIDLISEEITKVQITNGNQTMYLTETSTYEYDVNGNIVSIDMDDVKTRYQYDKLNRLIREDNPLLNQTIIYKYDKAGNILLKKMYDYSLDNNLYSPEVIEYVYDCDNRDRLISFDNRTIIYNDMGRPTTYKDNEYNWNNNGQLTHILKQNGDVIKYLYDINGIRKKKIVNGVETTFITNGSQILSITQGNQVLIFRYVLNKLVGFSYNCGSSTKEYIYQRNIQGDIIGIYDEDGKQVGGYVYDAYGNHVVTLDVDGISSLNPFRYRGYFYDKETGLYWVSSRYYDPETGRWISPDTLSILDETRGQINGLNLYMYCGDNPVMRVDPTGIAWWHWIIGVGVIALLAVATILTAGVASVGIGAAFTAGFTGSVIGFGSSGLAVTIAGSAFAGSVITAGIGFVGGALVGGLLTGTWSGALEGASKGFMIGAIIGAISGGISGGINYARTTPLIRSVSSGELDSLKSTGQFSSGGYSESKWFATNSTDASKWANLFRQSDYVGIRVPKSAIKNFYFDPILDNIGPAYCIDVDYLNLILKGIWFF